MKEFGNIYSRIGNPTVGMPTHLPAEKLMG